MNNNEIELNKVDCSFDVVVKNDFILELKKRRERLVRDGSNPICKMLKENVVSKITHISGSCFGSKSRVYLYIECETNLVDEPCIIKSIMTLSEAKETILFCLNFDGSNVSQQKVVDSWCGRSELSFNLI